jgi:hypothetical protein
MIFPYEGNLLAIRIGRRRHLANRLAEIPGVVLGEEGEWEKIFVFDVALIDQVADVVKPRKRRWTEEWRQKSRGRLAGEATPGPAPDV